MRICDLLCSYKLIIKVEATLIAIADVKIQE